MNMDEADDESKERKVFCIGVQLCGMLSLWSRTCIQGQSQSIERTAFGPEDSPQCEESQRERRPSSE